MSECDAVLFLIAFHVLDVFVIPGKDVTGIHIKCELYGLKIEELGRFRFEVDIAGNHITYFHANGLVPVIADLILPGMRFIPADAPLTQPSPPPRAPSNRLLASAPRRKKPYLLHHDDIRHILLSAKYTGII